MKRRSVTCISLVILSVLLGAAAPVQPNLGSRVKPVLSIEGLQFKDLNNDGRLNRYEDWRLTPSSRARDLVLRMSLEEKAGLLMHGNPPTVRGGLRDPWDLAAMAPLISQRHISFFIHRFSGRPDVLARTANAAQELAEQTRLGIPLTISSDPRNGRSALLGLSVTSGQFSQWPDPIGLAATGDPMLAKDHAATAAQEYRAVGIRMALSPMADLATEPRWPRINGTFGDDPTTAGKFVRAYVEGFQGGSRGVGPASVAAVVKHWVGYGAAPEGWDAHNPYGRESAFPGGRFKDHIRPFLPSFDVKVAGVMPTYSKPPPNLRINGRPAEQVGGGFSRQLLTELLRRRYRFEGIVLTDWKITDDCLRPCLEGTLDHDQVGMPWGVEHLSKSERFAKALDAGVDQFGGVMDTEVILNLVKRGRVAERRINASVERLLAQKLALGLFENPYVDPSSAVEVVGSAKFREAGESAQRKSLVLLENRGNFLPVDRTARLKVWLWQVSPESAISRGLQPVDSLEAADFAIVRISAPFRTRAQYFFGSRYHEGSLEYSAENKDLQAVERVAAAGVPLVVSAYLDRPAILTPIASKATSLFADFGVGDAALLDTIIGASRPSGRLPLELPSSEQAVRGQKPDVPSDSVAPLYPRGFGRQYVRGSQTTKR